MIDTLGRYPGIAVGSGLGSWLIKVMEWVDPLLSFILLFGSAIVVVLTVIIKWREVKKS